MTNESILDTILFQTAILHQDYGPMDPKLIRELQGRFGFWMDLIGGAFGMKGDKDEDDDEFEKPKEWTAPWVKKEND